MSTETANAFQFDIVTDKNVTALELQQLYIAAGFDWAAGEEMLDGLERSITGSTFVAHARNAEGKLIGFLSALSNGVYTTFIDLVVVDAAVQRRGIGSALVRATEVHFSGVPIYAMPFTDMHELFLGLGYRDKTRKSRTMVPVSKSNQVPKPDAVA